MVDVDLLVSTGQHIWSTKLFLYQHFLPHKQYDSFNWVLKSSIG